MEPTPRLHICFVTVEFHGLFKNGGIGTANTALALALAAQGFEVTVAIANAEAGGPRALDGPYAALQGEYATRGIKLEHVSPPAQDDARAASYAVYEYLRQRRFDIVLFNDNGGQGFYTLLAKQAGLLPAAPLLCVVAHGPLDWVAEINAQEYFAKGVATAYMEARCARLADVLISPSRYLLDWMTARGWVAPGHGHVLQNLIGAAAQPALAPPGPTPPVREIVFFGRQETRKGLDLFCDAIDRLDAGQDLTEVRVTFLGKFSKSNWVHSGIYVAERARRWRANLRVITEYDQQEALAYLRRPGVLAVVPSRAENSPCVVAECLIQGVPFLASSGGGTAELIAEADRASCLFPPDAAALAARLRTCLATGQQPGRLAVPQDETLRDWVALLTAPPPSPPAPALLPRLSLCLAWSPAPAFAATLLALRAQTALPHEIIIAGPDDAAFAAAICPGALKLPGSFAGRAAARNAAAAAASGDYLCFLDEARAVPAAQAMAQLATAAARTGAAIVTTMTEATGAPLAVGGCAELGLTEPCFGTSLWAVSRSSFMASGGFAPWRDGVLDWAYLARATLAGTAMELVPAPLAGLQPDPSNFTGSGQVDDQREIFALYAGQPLSCVTRLVESGVNWREAKRLGIAAFTASLPQAARPLLSGFGPIDANCAEARRLFAAYCCERRLPELALDYALHNDAALLPKAVHMAMRVNEDAARRALDVRALDMHHEIELTEALIPRLSAFHGVEPAMLEPVPAGLIRYALPAGLSVLKLAGACPPGTIALTLGARCDAAAPRLAAVLCRAWARPRLTLEGLEPDGTAWWSGWNEAPRNAPATLTLRLPAPATELLDLYLIAGRTGPGPATLTWQTVRAALCLTGDQTASALEVVEITKPVPPAQLARGEVLTDLTGVNFALYKPGPPTLLHPLADRLAVVLLPGLLPAGSAGLQCSVSLGHAQSRPVQFGLWARPAGSPPNLPEAPETEPCFSGWTECTAQAPPRPVAFRLPRDATGPWDVYLATRLVDQPDNYFCHALWHEFHVIEQDRTAPGLALPGILPAGAAAAVAPARAFLICAGPRTGSNLLATSLRTTGIAGSALEYFNAHSMNSAYMLNQLGVTADESDPPDFAGRMPQILRAGTKGGVFGATLHWTDREYLFAALRQLHPSLAAAPVPALLRAAFPGLRLIWLRREDKLAQAVSHHTARATGIWQKQAKAEAGGPPPEVPYDFKVISQLLQDAIDEEEGWRAFLAGQEADTLALTYESFVADYEATLSRVLAHLGLGLPPQGFKPPPYQRQADARSAELMALYAQEAAARKPRQRQKTA